MNNTAIKTVSLAVVKEMADQEVNVLKELLLTDPIKINSAIDIWTKRKSKASGEEAERCDKNIRNLYAILEQAIDVTMNIYNISVPEIKETATMVHERPAQTEAKVEETTNSEATEPIINEVDKSSTALRVVRDDDELRNKFQDLIKLRIEEFITRLKSLPKEDAVEAAHFILGNGLYDATTPKKWNVEKVNGWLKTTVFKEKKQKSEIAREAVSEVETLDEKYKDYVNNITLAQVGEKVRELVTNNKTFEALEFASYILSQKIYTDANKEDVEWTPETIQVYIDQVTSGLSSSTDIQDAQVVEESPFWDIMYKDVYEMINKASMEEGATIESLKAKFIAFLSENVEKSIEKIDDLIKESNAETVWEDLFATTMSYRLNEIARKKTLEEFEQNHAEMKKQAADEFLETYIKGNKEKFEKGELMPSTGTLELKKILHEKGFILTTITDAKELFKDLARRAALNVRWLKKEELPLPEATETKASEPVAIIGPQVSVDNNFPEIKEEVEKAKYLEDMYFISKKYTDTDKKAVALQLITNAFLDKKVFEKSDSEQPLDWTLEQVEKWLQTEMKTEENLPKDGPLVDAETDISKSTEDESSNENPFLKIKDKAGFIAAVVDVITTFKAENMDVKLIRSNVAKMIIDAKRNKKSFARSNYKNVKEGELFQAINKIAINANIEGFMNT